MTDKKETKVEEHEELVRQVFFVTKPMLRRLKVACAIEEISQQELMLKALECYLGSHEREYTAVLRGDKKA